LLSWSHQLWLLKNPIIRKWPKNFALGNRTNDFLGLGKHFLSHHIPTVLEKRTFSTPTVLTAFKWSRSDLQSTHLLLTSFSIWCRECESGSLAQAQEIPTTFRQAVPVDR